MPCPFRWQLPEEQPLERPAHPPGARSPQALTHPEVVEALGHGPVLRRDLRIEILVETWLQGDELGQGREVVHLFCKEKFRWREQKPTGFLNSPKN